MRYHRGFTRLVVLVLIAVVAIATVGMTVWFLNAYEQQPKQTSTTKASITTFEECAAAGYPIGESYPRQCFTNNQTFFEVIANANTGTPAETVLYTNTKHGYSIQLPANWADAMLPDRGLPAADASPATFIGPGFAGYTGPAQHGSWSLSIEAAVQTRCGSTERCIGADEQQMTIGGKAFSVPAKDPPVSNGSQYHIYYFSGNGLKYTFTTTAAAVDDAATRPVFEQMLASFTLTAKETAATKD